MNETNCSLNVDKWEIRRFRSCVKKKSAVELIHGGDVIMLKHSESGGYITLDELS
jgi:hypothetical protein